MLGWKIVGASLHGKATYHDSCAGLAGMPDQGGTAKLLAKVKGLELLEMNDVETCCGFGGSFAVKFEPISIAMADQKVNHALETGADYIISTDLSCLMHLDGYIRHKGYSYPDDAYRRCASGEYSDNLRKKIRPPILPKLSDGLDP